jgi:microcystin-dependent protein
MPVPKRYKAQTTELTAANLNRTGITNLWAREQATPDMTLFVEDGIAHIDGTVVKWAGGNSPAFTAPASNNRIDLLSLKLDGTLEIIQGVSAASPSVPDYPTSRFVICEVFLRSTATSIKNDDDATNGYVSRDSRGLVWSGGLMPIGAIVSWLKTFAQRSTGTNTSTSANKLINSAATFQTDGVKIGEIVENNTDGTFAYVTAVDSQTQLSLSADIFLATSKTYFVWKTPRLPENWAECNGQTLSDTGSPYNGVVIPNLNGASAGTKRFLRGSTRSGATGGEDTHVLTIAELAAHTHSSPNDCGAGAPGSGNAYAYSGGQGGAHNVSTTGSDTAHENRPPYYEVLWIIKVK